MATRKQPPRHILELTPEQKKEFLNSFDLALFDCDGVVWEVIGPIPNTGKALTLIQQEGKRCGFVSNNSLRSDEEYLRKLSELGVKNVQKSDLVHPVKTMIKYLQKHKPEARNLFSMCSMESNEELRKAGYDVEVLLIREHLGPKELYGLIKPQRKMDAVLIDINVDLNYAQMSKAYQYLLQNEDCIYLAGGRDPLIPLTGHMNTLGFCEFQDCLVKQTNRELIVLGKPSNILADLLKDIFDIKQPQRCLFVGDSLRQDVAFAKSCGFQTLFIVTNHCSKEEMLAAPEECQPNYYAYGLVDFIEFFKNI